MNATDRAVMMQLAPFNERKASLFFFIFVQPSGRAVTQPYGAARVTFSGRRRSQHLSPERGRPT
jgi:hypothetical protein